jgi:hypothetical protein
MAKMWRDRRVGWDSQGMKAEGVPPRTTLLSHRVVLKKKMACKQNQMNTQKKGNF